jgi:hypothetical protein
MMNKVGMNLVAASVAKSRPAVTVIHPGEHCQLARLMTQPARENLDCARQDEQPPDDQSALHRSKYGQQCRPGAQNDDEPARKSDPACAALLVARCRCWVRHGLPSPSLTCPLCRVRVNVVAVDGFNAASNLTMILGFLARTSCQLPKSSGKLRIAGELTGHSFKLCGFRLPI